MIVSKFHENRLTIAREIDEKHAILVDKFYCDFGYSIHGASTFAVCVSQSAYLIINIK